MIKNIKITDISHCRAFSNVIRPEKKKEKKIILNYLDKQYTDLT